LLLRPAELLDRILQAQRLTLGLGATYRAARERPARQAEGTMGANKGTWRFAWKC
jgi:hypothetical protein